MPSLDIYESTWEIVRRVTGCEPMTTSVRIVRFDPIAAVEWSGGESTPDRVHWTPPGVEPTRTGPLPAAVGTTHRIVAQPRPSWRVACGAGELIDRVDPYGFRQRYWRRSLDGQVVDADTVLQWGKRGVNGFRATLVEDDDRVEASISSDVAFEALGKPGPEVVPVGPPLVEASISSDVAPEARTEPSSPGGGWLFDLAPERETDTRVGAGRRRAAR